MQDNDQTPNSEPMDPQQGQPVPPPPPPPAQEPVPGTPLPVGGYGEFTGEVTQDEKTQAMLCWLLSIFIGVISPVIFMITGKEKPFIYRTAMQCLTFNIAMIVVWIVFFVLSIIVGAITCGIGSLLAFVPYIPQIVIPILGTIATNNGKLYEPPVTGNLAKQWFKV